MRRGYRTHAYKGILSALLIACTDAVAPVNERAESRSFAREANDVARGIALALGSPQLRAVVRDAMRASPLNEHKLVLQQFVDTPEGRQLVAAAARALAVSEERFTQTVKALPEFDFYAPFARHRREWRATADVLVAATFDPDNRYLEAYSVDGEPIRLDHEDGTPSRALLILHPAETKARRLSLQRATTGETIQDADEDQVRVAARNRLNSVGFSPDSTYIDFWNFHTGDGWAGDSELRFEATFYDGVTHQLYYGTYRQGNVEEDEGYDVTAPLIDRHPRYSGDRLIIELWEDDWGGECSAFPVCDDDMGSVEYNFEERRVMKVFHPSYPHDDTEIIVDWFAGYNRIPSRVTTYPSSVTVSAGGTVQFFYSVFDQTGAALRPEDHAAPTWESFNTAVATVSSTGLLTGGPQEASTTVRLTVCPSPGFGREGSPCAQTTVPVHVQVPIASVVISPNPVNVPAGQWAYVNAIAYDANNQPIPGVSFTWQTDNPAIATASGGTVTGVAQGSTIVRATPSGGRPGPSGTATVNVSGAPPLQVSIQGNFDVPPYTTCRWWAAITNGVEPYTYRWYVSGSLVSEYDQLSWTSSTSGFDIRLDITDGNGRTASDSRYINVSSSSGGCVDM